MTSRADVTRLSRAQSSLVAAAKRDLARFWATLDMSDPAVVRDELIEVMATLTATYGDVAATAAAEWYEQVRGDAVGGAFTARLADTVGRDQVEATVRYAAGHLWGDDPAATLAGLEGSLQRFVMYAGRETVARNSSIDPAKPAYARVPQGAKTCAFCEMLASRGWVYTSEQTAGGLGHKYHNDCDCQVVPQWDRDKAHIDGYDPDAMFSRYQDARAVVQRAGGNPNDPSELMATMRRMFPDQYTDGVH